MEHEHNYLERDQRVSQRSIAGRHAADHQRARDRALPDPKLVALEALAAVLRKRPLRVMKDFVVGQDQLPTIALKVRMDYFGLDYLFVDTAVNELGWRGSIANLSRRNETHDVRVLEHASGARLLLLIALPHGDIEHVEAA